MAIDEIIVKRRLASNLEECQFIQQLEEMTHDEFIGDGRNLRASAKAIENISQLIVDIGSHIIAQSNWGIPETYKEAIELLGTHRVIPKNLTKNLKNLVSLRNIFVHRYIDADYDILWSSLERVLSDARSFVSFIREYLDQKQSL
ncbi:MAG: DUF86 domain-containing protein [Candidatus Lokiarchaeota archaeon]|nr:DUF86 domain-containing protein [Candidatus Lokiarchaeota archaeon]